MRASPMVRSFNSGEFSALLEGRPDLDKYPSSMRRLFNAVAAPQGPAICRSGTAYMGKAYNQAKSASLIPFVFNETQSLMLEFAPDRVRFWTDDGIQVYAPVAYTIVSTTPFVINSATLNGAVGDDVVLSGYTEDYNLNREIIRITAVVGTQYTLDKPWPVGKASAPGSASLVYKVPCVYTDTERKYLTYVQSVDVLYLLTDRRPRKLSRYGAYDWRLEDVQFIDGPFMPLNDTSTSLTPAGTGNAVPVMTTNTAPSGVATGSGNRAAIAAGGTFLGRTISYALGASDYFYAFDAADTYWAGNAAQAGIIEYDPAAAFICDGYAIQSAIDNQDASYTSKDYAPGSWTFEGFDGTNWIVLDTQEEYVLYTSNKSLFFEVNNTTAYTKYRLNITKLTRNGSIEPRVRRLIMRSTTAATFNLVASSVVGINRDTGFALTDVGRLVRLRASDSTWRSCLITAFVSTTTVTVKLQGEPLPDQKPIKNWRLGYWSDTTGWPTTGDFFDDRLCLGGSTDAPDVFAMSVAASYELFSQTNNYGEVLDESAVVARLNARRLSRIQWLQSDEKGLLIGTGSTEYVVTSAKGDSDSITARSIRARASTSRGSARVNTVKIDRQVLYIQRSGRTLREYAYNYEADGYKSPSMSQLASHIGVKRFVQMDYAAEPYGILWLRKEDGSVAGFTYNRDESVLGWHQHDFSEAMVESIAVMPSSDQLQDTLWMQVARTVNGETHRYIERLTRLWDFDMEIEDAHYVDCALRYEGAATTSIYGLQHLEGRTVYGLYDGKPILPKVVANGMIELDEEGSDVIIGLGFDSLGETARLENGAADGTAFGKTKRMNEINLGVWASYGGQIGTFNENNYDETIASLVGLVEYVDIDYTGVVRGDEFVGPFLYTGEIPSPVIPQPGNERRGSLHFRRPKEMPLPFNITYIAPKLTTQDAQ